MSTATFPLSRAVAALATADCLDLLDGCRSASLACIERARPSVIPVEVAVVGTQIRVALPVHSDAGAFDGQVVALGAALTASPRQQGWWVVVRGRLQRLPGETALLLEAEEIEGAVLAAPSYRRWWR